MCPSPSQLSILLYYIFFCWFIFFIWKLSNKFFQKLRLYSEQFCQNLVFILPFTSTKKPRLILELHLRKKKIFGIKIISFFYEPKFYLPKGKTSELCRWSLETDLLAIIKNYMIPSFVNTFSYIHVNIYNSLKTGMYFVASTIH